MPRSLSVPYTYVKWTVRTWNNSAGVEISAKTTFSAVVPFVASAEFEISVSASYSHEWGGEEGTKQVINASTTVTIPPWKKDRATITISDAQLDVPFTYTQRMLWSNGQSADKKKDGIYNNVDVVPDNWENV